MTTTEPLPQNPVIDIVKDGTFDAGADGFADPGELISYSFTVTNEGNVSLTNVSVTDPLPGLSAITFDGGDTDGDGELDVDEIWTYSATYAVTQADIDAGNVVNTATADSDESDPDEDDNTEPLPQNPALAVDKALTDNADEDGSTTVSVGDTLEYTITATNTGNVTLNNVTVSDDLTGDSTSCLSVAPAATCVLTVNYVVTQADVDAGVINNVGTADSDETPPTEDPENVPVPQDPSIDMDKFGSWNDDGDGFADPGETIDYEFVVTNDGNVSLSNVLVTDPLVGPVDCPQTTLAVDESMTCTASYTLTQADIDAGFVTNNALATGEGPQGQLVEDPGDWTQDLPQDPSIDMDKFGSWNDDGDGFADPGETIDYEFVVTNDGNVSLSNVLVTDPLVGPVDCPQTTLAVDESMTCTASYTLTQADIDAGFVTNNALATGEGPQGQLVEDPGDWTQDLPQDPSIDMDKFGSWNDDGDGFADPGETIDYEFVVTNDGNVSLSNVLVTDPLVGPVDCPQTTLAVDESMTCTASYTLTQADIDAGFVTNNALATGEGPQGQLVEDPGDWTQDLPQDPSIDMDKFGSWNDDGDGFADPGETIDYEFVVTNDGNVSLSNVLVTDPLVGPVDCPQTTLAVDESMTCTASYTLTQADIDAGFVTNNALATGEGPQGQLVEDPGDWTQDLPQDPSILATKTGVFQDENQDGFADPGETISYTFTVENDGNVTVTNLTVSDPLVSLSYDSGDTDTDGDLDVGETWIYTGSYAVTQTDIDAGKVDNTALAEGTDPNGDPVIDDDDHSEPLPQNPAQTLTKEFKPNPIGKDEVGTFELVYKNTGNVTLFEIDITDTVDERLVVQSATSTDATCFDPDGDPQTILCEVDELAPGGVVTITVEFVALGDDFTGIGEFEDQRHWCELRVLLRQQLRALRVDRHRRRPRCWMRIGTRSTRTCGTSRAQTRTSSSPSRTPGGDDGGFFLHLSCSEAFIDGWGSTGPIEGEDDEDWKVDAYEVYRFNSQGFLKDCAQTFTFEVPNTATASATPPIGAPDLADVDGSDTLTVTKIAPIEVTRERVRRGDVEIQYFNTSFEPITIEIIRVEWTDPNGTVNDVKLEFASYQDGVPLGIGLEAGDDGCYNGANPLLKPDDLCRLQASISTEIPARSKDWLKLSFDSGKAPAGLTITIVTDNNDGTFTYVYGS